MLLKVFYDKLTLGAAAAEQATAAIQRAIAERARHGLSLPPPRSQLEFLDALTKAPGIDWTKVEAFHLDDKVWVFITHPGSFRKMLVRQVGEEDWNCADITCSKARPLDPARPRCGK